MPFRQQKAYQVEVSKLEKVKEGVEKALHAFGRLNVFVANARIAISKPILEQIMERDRRQIEVNVDGVFFRAKFAGEVSPKQGRGNLIITSSISAHIVNVPVDQPVFNSTKAAVTYQEKSLAREWREFARVDIVSPGFFDTKMAASPEVINEGLRLIS